MSATDWVLLAILAASAVFGLMRGFVGAAASLMAWVLAGWAAFRYGAQLALLLADGPQASLGELATGYALCFVGVMLLVGLVGWLVRQAVKSAGLSGVDRAFGLLLGLARGAFVACALVLLLGLTGMPRDPAWQGSSVVPLFVPGAELMRGWLPGWVAAQVDFGDGVRGLHGGAPLPVPAGG